jgi:hypothetical protein
MMESKALHDSAGNVTNWKSVATALPNKAVKQRRDHWRKAKAKTIKPPKPKAKTSVTPLKRAVVGDSWSNSAGSRGGGGNVDVQAGQRAACARASARARAFESACHHHRSQFSLWHHSSSSSSSCFCA